MTGHTLNDLPLSYGIHCRRFGVARIAIDGYGRSNLFFVTPPMTCWRRRHSTIWTADTTNLTPVESVPFDVAAWEAVNGPSN
jgi:hypothetical protein